MRNEIRRMDNKPIKIKQGVNWKTFIAMILFITVLIALISVNYWMPDNRSLKTVNKDDPMKFDGVSVLVESYGIDMDKKLGEVLLCVKSNEIDNRLNYGVSYDGAYVYAETSYKVIKGSVLPSDKEDEYMQEVIVQFDVPDVFYYISLLVEQQDYKQLEFPMDYRLIEQKNIDRKGSEYLKKLDDINVEIVKSKKVIDEVQKQVDGYTKTIQAQEKKIADLEIQIKAVVDEKAQKEKQVVIDVEKKALEENQKKLTESKERLSDEQRTLEKLEQDKIKQR